MLYLPLLVTSSRFCRPVEGVIHQFPFVAPRFFFLKKSQPRSMTTFQPSRKDTFFNRVAQPTGFHASAINCYLHWRVSMEGFNDPMNFIGNLASKKTTAWTNSTITTWVVVHPQNWQGRVDQVWFLLEQKLPRKHTFSWQKEVNYPRVYIPFYLSSISKSQLSQKKWAVI